MKIIDLFAGCGGFSHGFQQAGYEVIGFVEWWQPAVTTFLKNHPQATHLGTDITKVPNEALYPYRKKVDIIVGGPPCQGFSMCGKRNPNDNRNKLYEEFLRFVEIIQPPLVVMENVPGILSMDDKDGRKVIDRIVYDFIKIGYAVTYKVLLASDYGVPQNRKRLIIVAKKCNPFPKAITEKKTVLEALLNLPQNCNAQEFFSTKEETLEKIKKLPQGQKLSNTFNFSRQRLHPYYPSRTVTTKPIFIHPFEDRFLTPRELARLQSFPDNFLFAGSKTDMVKQIGNAVPPLMAQAIAEKLKEVFP